MLRHENARLFHTVVLMYSFLVIGVGLVITGPTLLDLSQQTGQSLTVVSATLSARSAGYIVGSCLISWLYPVIDFQVTAVVCLLSCGLAFSIVPFLSNIWALLAAFVINGGTQSAYETGAYIFITRVWGSASGPYMQAVTLFFATGALIAPLIARPFLTNPDAGDYDDTSNGTTAETGGHSDLRLYYPYSILGFMLTIAAVLNFALRSLTPETLEKEWESGVLTEGRKCRSKKWKVTTVILCMSFIFFYYGIDSTLGSYLVTFGVMSDLRLSKSTGALITTAFWGSQIAPKVIAIMLAKWMGNECLIVCSLIVIMTGNVILVPFGNSSQFCLWIGVMVVGVGLSAIWGAMFGYVEDLIGPSSAIGSFIIISAMNGEFVFPFVISFVIEADARILLWTVLCCSSVCVAIFAILMFMRRTVLHVGQTE